MDLDHVPWLPYSGVVVRLPRTAAVLAALVLLLLALVLAFPGLREREAGAPEPTWVDSSAAGAEPLRSPTSLRAADLPAARPAVTQREELVPVPEDPLPADGSSSLTFLLHTTAGDPVSRVLMVHKPFLGFSADGQPEYGESRGTYVRGRRGEFVLPLDHGGPWWVEVWLLDHEVLDAPSPPHFEAPNARSPIALTLRGPARVEVVVDNEGLPLERAQVSLAGALQWTDSLGRARFDKVSSGERVLQVSYEEIPGDRKVWWEEHLLEPGADVRLQVSMPRFGGLVVRVLDAVGGPWKQGTVALTRGTLIKGEPIATRLLSSSHEADFGRLPEGSYVAQYLPPDRVEGEAGSILGTFHVPAGEPVGFDVYLP